MRFILQRNTIYSTSREKKTTCDPNLQQLSEAILPKQVTGIFLTAANSFSALKMGHDSVFREKNMRVLRKMKIYLIFDIFGAS